MTGNEDLRLLSAGSIVRAVIDLFSWSSAGRSVPRLTPGIQVSMVAMMAIALASPAFGG
jgi:hypothetical protein